MSKWRRRKDTASHKNEAFFTSICVSINRIMTTENIFWLEVLSFSICFKLKNEAKQKQLNIFSSLFYYFIFSIPSPNPHHIPPHHQYKKRIFFCVVFCIFIIILYTYSKRGMGIEKGIKIIIKFLYSTLSRFRTEQNTSEREKKLHCRVPSSYCVFCTAARQIAYPNELLIGWK